MKLFLRNVGQYLKDYPQIRLSRTDEILIKESSLKFLGLDNINHLRDRYEGQAFLDKTIKNIGALLACQKFLNLEVTDLDKINLRDFCPQIRVKGKILVINVFDFGELPSVDLNNNKIGTVFVIQKDKSTFLICGFAEPEFIQNHLVESSEVTSSSKIFKTFIGFKELQSIHLLK